MRGFFCLIGLFFFFSEKLTGLILFDRSSSFLGKEQAPVIANPGIGTRSVNGSEPMSLSEKKHSYGNKNPELVLCCYLSRMHK